MAEIIKTTLTWVEEGQRILTPNGLLPTIEYVDWQDDSADDLVTIEFDDDSQATGTGDTKVHVVAGDEADEVTPAQLAKAPEPAWTVGIGESVEERVDAAYAAHVAGDRERVLEQTSHLLDETFTGDYNVWSPIEAGLALRAFVLADDAPASVEISARLDVEDFDPLTADSFKAILERQLLAPLDELPSVRLRDVVVRWARGGAGEFDRPRLLAEHDATLAALRQELREDG